MTTIEDNIRNYVCGNISDCRKELNNCMEYTLADFLDYYIENYHPSKSEIVLFIRRLSK